MATYVRPWPLRRKKLSGNATPRPIRRCRRTGLLRLRRRRADQRPHPLPTRQSLASRGTRARVPQPPDGAPAEAQSIVRASGAGGPDHPSWRAVRAACCPAGRYVAVGAAGVFRASPAARRQDPEHARARARARARTHTHTHTDTDTHRHRHTHTQTHTDTDTHRHTHTHTHTLMT